MTLCLTDTMKRTKEPFAPPNPDHVTMYVCGPTVYNFAHIGNARPAVVFDVLYVPCAPVFDVLYRLLKRRFARGHAYAVESHVLVLVRTGTYSDLFG